MFGSVKRSEKINRFEQERRVRVRLDVLGDPDSLIGMGEGLQYPRIIQGGMGAGVSHWLLARKVSMAGQLGVVSGTALDVILSRRLQDGDESGDMRRALAAFPDQDIAQRILDRHFIPGGRRGKAYRPVDPPSARPPQRCVELTIAANFVEIFLAKEGHSGVVGINYLEKIQMVLPSAIYGALLASIDFVLVGAGIPTQIPGILDLLSKNQSVSMRVNVEQAGPQDDFRVDFDPKQYVKAPGELKRPAFFPIIASVVVAKAMMKRATGTIEGFVIENHTAGGHNAPPREAGVFSDNGEPLYGAKDDVDLAKIREMGLPFYLAGGYAFPEKLSEAASLGATGVQIGTPFAVSSDSGLAPELRELMLTEILEQRATVTTDMHASPTGFPFKVLALPGTCSELELYEERPRLCDLGYLRTLYRDGNGNIGYRCPAEDVNRYVAKGGLPEETVGRKCLCNALMANIGMPQIRGKEDIEMALITVGSDLSCVETLIDKYGRDYTALDVIDYLS